MPSIYKERLLSEVGEKREIEERKQQLKKYIHGLFGLFGLYGLFGLFDFHFIVQHVHVGEVLDPGVKLLQDVFTNCIDILIFAEQVK